MKAEDYITEWCDKTYKGGKELGDWTTEEVMKFANDFANLKLNVFTSASDLRFELSDQTDGKNIMVETQNKTFRCDCGCYVFQHLIEDNKIIKCNACGAYYTSEQMST